MIILKKRAVLDTLVATEALRGVVFSKECMGHKFVITCVQNGEALPLTGTISARFMRSDGSTIYLGPDAGEGHTGYTAVVDGNAEVTLHQDCYNVPGRFKLTIFHTEGGSSSVIYSCVSEVDRSQGGTLIDSGSVVPSLDQFVEYIDDCIQATEDAEAAAQGIDDIVLQQETQPQSESNKIWFPSATPEGVDVPTFEEFSEVKSAVTDIEQMKYKAVLTALGESNKQVFYANPGDTIEIKTADGSNFTANNVYFKRLDGTGPYWGLDHATNTKTVEIGTSNQNPIYYTYLYMGTAQKIIVTNLTSIYSQHNLETAVDDLDDQIDTLDSDKLNKIANISINVSEFAQAGSAMRDGTIGNRTDRRYVKKGCDNVSSLIIHTALWFVPAVLFYDSTGAVISTVEGNESGAQDITTNIPSGATSYAVNCAASNISELTITEVMQYENAVSEVYNDVEAIKREIDTSGPELVLPAFYPAVVGFPSYVKYESILSNAYLRQYFCNFAGGVYGAFGDGYFNVPQSAGDSTKTFELYQGNKVIAKASTVQRTVAANAGGTAKCLIIGDSKSASQSPWVTLHDLLDADSNMTLTFLGTVTSGYIPREAYSGKSIINVCNDQYITGTTPNIFYDANVTTTNNHHFSLAQGVQTLGETPDIVIIDHGANQWASSWETVKGCYDDVIASIHAVDEDIKIVIVIQEGTGLAERPTHVTDGKWWLDNTSYANAHKLLDEYKNKETDNIFIMPTYMSVDLYRDFPLCKIPQFEGADGDFDMCMDGIHPGLNTSSWSASTQYKYGAWVSRNGNGYGCKKANSNTDPETDDGTYWAKCFNLGDGYKKKGMMYYYMLKYLMTVN